MSQVQPVIQLGSPLLMPAFFLHAPAIGGHSGSFVQAVELNKRVEVTGCEVRITGSKSNLLQTLAAAAGVKPAMPGVRGSVLKWRRGPRRASSWVFRPP